MQKTLNDLFLEQLKDIYFAEKQIYKTLPKMAKAAKISQLKGAFTAHREQTHGHIARLEEVFETIGRRPQAKTCEAIKGIISEGEETIEDFGESEVLDDGLVAAGQAVEHYEMARYGALIAWAKQMNMPDAAALLNETLQEEIKADQLPDPNRAPATTIKRPRNAVQGRAAAKPPFCSSWLKARLGSVRGASKTSRARKTGQFARANLKSR